MRWVRARDGSGGTPELTLPTGAKQAKDASGLPVALLTNAWSLGYFESKNPDYEISPVPFK